MTGTTVGTKKDGTTSNIRYRTVSLTHNSLGFSTQLVSFTPHPICWHKYATMDPTVRFELEHFLFTNRPDLQDYMWKSMGSTAKSSLFDVRHQRSPVPSSEANWLRGQKNTITSTHPAKTSVRYDYSNVMIPIQLELPAKRVNATRGKNAPLWQTPRPLPLCFRKVDAFHFMQLLLSSPLLRNCLLAKRYGSDSGEYHVTNVVRTLIIGNPTDESSNAAAATFLKKPYQNHCQKNLNWQRKTVVPSQC